MLSYRKMEWSGSDMTFYQILWTFFIYSFVGWCCEVAFAACKTGQFVNRGFLFGPLCPIYGFGVVAALLLMSPSGSTGSRPTWWLCWSPPSSSILWDGRL